MGRRFAPTGYRPRGGRLLARRAGRALGDYRRPVASGPGAARSSGPPRRQAPAFLWRQRTAKAALFDAAQLGRSLSLGKAARQPQIRARPAARTAGRARPTAAALAAPDPRLSSGQVTRIQKQPPPCRLRAVGSLRLMQLTNKHWTNSLPGLTPGLPARARACRPRVLFVVPALGGEGTPNVLFNWQVSIYVLYGLSPFRLCCRATSFYFFIFLRVHLLARVATGVDVILLR